MSVNPNIKWKDINWKQAEVRVFKLQRLIYRASSRGEGDHGLKTAKDLKAVNFLKTH
ncbi:MAG: reverse transcriptase N-terminal domain-containing protein [Trichodesmium sp. MAG_R04]|nr:reverse transcriptase N-terminal domain-containing protein [Trichodesmium sp. MAG_R04]